MSVALVAMSVVFVAMFAVLVAMFVVFVAMFVVLVAMFAASAATPALSSRSLRSTVTSVVPSLIVRTLVGASRLAPVMSSSAIPST